jgi:uncharacterized protein (DUF1778 family)
MIEAVKRARQKRGRTLTEFVVSAAEETEIIRLSLEGRRQIGAAILNPPAPTPALKKAAKRYRELFGAA